MMNEDIKVFPWLKDIEQNLIKDYTILPEKDSKQEISTNELSTLRDEIKIIHKTYRDDLSILNEVLVSKNNHIQKLLTQIDILDNNHNDLYFKYKELHLLKELLINSREEWIGKALKLHYLFQEMDKIGLKQSDDIFEAYKDIEMPINEIPIQIRERYIPTILTNVVEVESSDEEF